MPELPEVETVRRGLQPVWENSVIDRVEQRRPDLRFPFPKRFSTRLEGRRVHGLARRAKYLLAHLDTQEVLICHLGMSGSFRIEASGDLGIPGNFAIPRGKSNTHDHVVFHLTTGAGVPAKIIYNDPRRFGYMLLSSEAELTDHRLFAKLGIEPTGNALDGQAINALFAGKRTHLKAALLDQRLIAGLGNIYVCEALWRARLDPRRPAGSITGPSRDKRAICDDLALAVREVIAEAIDAGGSSLRDHVQADGSLGYFQHTFNVYDREGEPCARTECTGTVTRLVQSGRSTFFCDCCQR